MLYRSSGCPERGSLRGVFLQKDESLDDAAGRVLNNLTGLKNIYLEKLHAFDEVNRDPVERTISVACYVLINIHAHDKELVKQHSASWLSIHDLPELIFDHDHMVEAALKRLRFKASHQLVGFELLP